jgi:transcriptional regulator with XRE-family HTH domain
MPEFENALQTRLAQLAEKHGQAEIARKTGVSRQNVSRYLKGRRVPLEFGAALVKGLGVNPAWVLVGEGSPYLADVNAATAETASDMLEMVRAMEAVSRRRLGELAGKDYARTLRELNDSLQSFDRIRERLNEQTRPLLQQLTKDLENATHAGQLAHARSLNEACLQLARFCTDEGVRDAHIEMQVLLQYRLGNDPAALQLAQGVFLRRLGLSTRDPRWFRSAYVLVVGTMRQGQSRQARRLCNATLAIMADGGGDTNYYQRMLSLSGVLDAELGDLHSALGKLMLAAFNIDRAQHPHARLQLEFGQLLGGATDLDLCLRGYRPAERIHRSLLSFACWVEDPELVKRTLGVYKQRIGSPDEGGDSDVVHAELMLAAIKNGRAPEFEPAAQPLQVFIKLVNYAQLQRLAGNRKAAAELNMQAHKALGSLPDDVTPPLLTRATHARNCIECAPKRPGAEWQRAVEDAHGFFENHVAAGYGCFRDMVKRPAGSPTTG